MRKMFGLAVVTWGLFSLSGCMLRTTGPCLGYGCPALSGDGGAHAQNRPYGASQANPVAANRQAAPPEAEEGK
jgi:hypothetical protein